jgi:lysophospholipase L1-like esterase
MLLEKGQRLLFIGDSITDCDRARPHGEGRFALGNGYVALVEAFLQSSYPELCIRVVNKGISGNTVRDLKARWQEDVLDERPDWLSVMIGINDVWRYFDTPHMPERHVPIDEYEATLRELVGRTRDRLKGLVLMTPFYLEPDENEPMRARMDLYGRVVGKIASETGAIFVDTQAAFKRTLDALYPSVLAWDRVHPTLAGHMVLARAFLTAIGFDWNRLQTPVRAGRAGVRIRPPARTDREKGTLPRSHARMRERFAFGRPLGAKGSLRSARGAARRPFRPLRSEDDGYSRPSAASRKAFT